MSRFKRKIQVAIVILILIPTFGILIPGTSIFIQEKWNEVLSSFSAKAPTANAQSGVQFVKLVNKFQFRTDKANSEVSDCLPNNFNGNYYRDYAQGCAFVNAGIYSKPQYQLNAANQCTYVRGIRSLKYYNGCVDYNPDATNYRTEPISSGIDSSTNALSYVNNYNVEFTYNPADNFHDAQNNLSIIGSPGPNRARSIARFITKNININSNTKISMQGCYQLNGSTVCRTPGFDDGYRIALVPSYLPLNVVDIDIDPRVYNTGVLVESLNVAANRGELTQQIPYSRVWEQPAGVSISDMFTLRTYSFSNAVQCTVNDRENYSAEDVLYDATTGQNIFRQADDMNNGSQDNYGIYNSGPSTSLPGTHAGGAIPTGTYNIIIEIYDICGAYHGAALADSYIRIEDKIPPATPVPYTCSSMYFVDVNTGVVLGTSATISATNQNVRAVYSGVSPTPTGAAEVGIYYQGIRQRGQAAAPAGTGGNGYTASANFNYSGFSSITNSVVFDLYPRIPGASGDTITATCHLRLTYLPPSNPTIVTTRSAANVACSAGNLVNPYSIKVAISAVPSNAGGAINRMSTVLMPQSPSTDYAYTSSGTLANPASLGQNIYVSSNGVTPTVIAPAGVAVTLVSMGASPTPGETLLQFTVTFPNYSTAQRYYAYDLYRTSTFVGDVNGRNNLVGGLGQVPNPTLSNAFNPFQNCSQLYYQTSGGDMRVAESRATTPNKYKRILRVANVNVDINFGVLSNVKFGDYQFEGLSANFCSNVSRVYSTSRPAYCTGTTDTQYAARQMDNLARNISRESAGDDAAENTVYEITSANATSLGPTAGVSVLGSKIVIDLSSQLGKTNKVIYKVVSIPAGTTVEVNDYVNNSSPNNIVVWCQLAGCNLVINPLNGISLSSFSHNTSNDVITIGLTSGVVSPKEYLRRNGRLYLNYLSGESAASASNRSIRLNSPANGTAYYYNGAFITSGYFYTNLTSNINLMKGLVSARGIVASGTNSGATNRDLYFKNFYAQGSTTPVLYIDYDPKYIFVFNDLIEQPSESVPRTIIGL